MLIDGMGGGWLAGQFRPGVPRTTRQLLHQDEGQQAPLRQKPGMPKLRFMNGTKWGVVIGDDPPERIAA